MRRKHPLQQFLDRHQLSQSELARSVRVTRETVNRWIRRQTVPGGTNLLRTIAFARAFEPAIEAGDLFPTRPLPRAVPTTREILNQSWGDACAVCRVPWDLPTEHLPMALLYPNLEGRPSGELCEGCAQAVLGEDSEPKPEPGLP